MISKGLIKKIIISNFIAINLVDRVFDAPSIYSGFENLLAIYGYGLQIYCDFSGYTDIAIGVALILGFRLPVILTHPIKQQVLLTSGKDGIFHSLNGFAIICISHWEVTGKEKSGLTLT